MTATNLGRLTDAVIRQIDNCGIVDAMRSRGCDAAQVRHLDRLYHEGRLGPMTQIHGWGHMTHHVRHEGRDYHVRIEE